MIGSSHSAILILRTLLNHTSLHIVNLFRSALRYAEYLDDGRIKYDNTGLKGEAAAWAKANLCDEQGTCCDGRIERICTVAEEARLYDYWLPKCNWVVWAIGYERNEMPKVKLENKIVTILGHDGQQRLIDANGHAIPGLFGLGIAFPELVLDPSGAYEQSVGLYKFLRAADKLPL